MSANVIRVPENQVNVEATLTLGKVLVESGFFGDSRGVAQAVVKIMAGRELGFGPIASMTGIIVIRGRVTLSANLIGACIRRSGRYDYRVKQLDDQRCVIEFLMDGQVIGVSSFSSEDAKVAGLASGDNWRKYPRNMLFARALSNGARWYCPDVFGGPVYTPDEVGASVEGESREVIEAEVVAEPESQPTPSETISPEQYERLDQLVRRKGANLQKLMSHYQVESLCDLTTDQFDDAIAVLSDRPDK